MPRRYGTAGKSTYKMADRWRKKGIIIGIIAGAIIFIAYFLLTHSKSYGIAGVGFLILFMLIIEMPNIVDILTRPAAKDFHRANRGAVAEEMVGDMLDNLGEDYYVLHDIECPHGNIDHIVISKHNGIYLIETKSHHGTVTIANREILLNGHLPEKDFIKQTLSNTYWLRDAIKQEIRTDIWITPIIVFTNAFVQGGKPIHNIHIVNKKYLLPLIERTQAYQNPANKSVWEKIDEIIARLIPESNQEQIEELSSSTQRSIKMCPKCGSPLIRRTAKAGKYEGQEFDVCANYPTCKTAIPINKNG